MVGIVLQTGILEAGQGPFSLELLLRTAELPQEWQVVAEVAYQLRLISRSKIGDRQLGAFNR